MECLRIGVHLAYLLDSAVDIAQIDVDFLDNLTVDSRAETEHTMCGGVLRAYVDHKVIRLEYATLLLYNLAVALHPHVGKVGLTLVLD